MLCVFVASNTLQVVFREGRVDSGIYVEIFVCFLGKYRGIDSCSGGTTSYLTVFITPDAVYLLLLSVLP